MFAAMNPMRDLKAVGASLDEGLSNHGTTVSLNLPKTNVRFPPLADISRACFRRQAGGRSLEYRTKRSACMSLKLQFPRKTAPH